MAIINEIDITSGGGDFLDTRDVKADAKGIKVRLYGDQVMGYAYYQNSKDDEGKEIVKNVKSKGVPKMENQTDGYQGAEQKPTKNLYSVVWDYAQEKPAILTVDKVSVIAEITNVEKNEDLKAMTDYDFRITFDGNEAPANKYKVVRLDATALTKDQEKDLKAFAKTVDLEAFADGGRALPDSESNTDEEVAF